MLIFVSIQHGLSKMETIGKVLSLTLLTIFGSAAGAIYLVDSDIFPNLIEKTPIVYSSDSKTETQEIETFEFEESDHAEYRMRRSEVYYEVSSNEGYDAGQDNGAIWTQTYGSGENGASDRAIYLASVNSLSSLKQNLDHWGRQYRNAKENGQKRTASLAYSNYQDYQKAIEIKSKSEPK